MVNTQSEEEREGKERKVNRCQTILYYYTCAILGGKGHRDTSNDMLKV
jgi:hypothetical protein